MVQKNTPAKYTKCFAVRVRTCIMLNYDVTCDVDTCCRRLQLQPLMDQDEEKTQQLQQLKERLSLLENQLEVYAADFATER